MTEKLGLIQQANATATSPTGALGTAMSFAHDIVMMTDDAIAIGLGVDTQVRLEYLTFFVIRNEC